MIVIFLLNFAAAAFHGRGGGSRVSQIPLHLRYPRVCATKHMPRGRFRLLERRHGFAEIGECGAGVLVEGRRIN